jgi:hypothetical protein
MQVRYQAAPRSDTICSDLDARVGTAARGANDTLFFLACSPSLLPRADRPERSPPQYLHELLELRPHLLDDLLALRRVRSRFLAAELVARAAYREALVV